MSENTEQNHLPEDNEELEKLLGGLEPSALEAPLKDELLRDLDRIEAVRNPAGNDYDPTRIQWRKVIPVTVFSVVAMMVFSYSKYGNVFSFSDADQPVSAAVETEARSVTSISPGQFQPVSSQGYLLDASSGGVVETENGPGEIMQLQYRDAYHWHDPDTGTNIRFFQPREEEIVVPLIID